MKSLDQYWNKERTVTAFNQKPASPDVIGFLEENVYPYQNKNALDLGCGGGRHTVLLARYGFNTFACDLHKEMIKAAQETIRESNLSADIRQASANQLPYDDNSFDFVLSTGVLHNFIIEKDIEKSIHEVSRVCKKKSHFLLTIFTNETISPELQHVSDNLYETADNIPMILISPDHVDDLCYNVGFEKTKVIRQYITKVETGVRSVYTCGYKLK